MSNQPQEQSYVDVKLLECSRRSSVEYLSGNAENNAIFTNKLDSGIQLDVGDTINIHSAIVSERGAGNDTIELKGNVLGTSKLQRIINMDTYSFNKDYKDTGYRNVLNKYDAINYYTTDPEIELKDNNVNMSVLYYKSTNGENCFSLPRRFAFKIENNHNPYDQFDQVAEGAVLTQLRNGTFVESDYSRDRNENSQWNASWLNNRELVKVRQDGTKFSLFVRLYATYFNASGGFDGAASLTGSINGNGSIDPAVDSYVPYRELKSITIPTGRRSADFISETFTNSLQNASNLDGYDYWNIPNNPSTSNVYDLQGVFAGTYRTDTFKPFNCANGSNFSETKFEEVKKFDNNASPGDPNKQITQARLDWVNNYLFVAFKRPEFVETGRKTWLLDEAYLGLNYTHITHVSNDMYYYSQDNLTITFNWEYNDYNCYELSLWLKTQELYPEFWDFRNASGAYYSKNASNRMTSDNCRFLHLDMLQAYESASKTLCSDRKEFGSDMYYEPGEQATVESTIIKYNTPSQPLFFTYRKTDENTFYENPEYSTNNKKLSYGAFLKGKDGKIMITTEGIGVPREYYNASEYFIGGEASAQEAQYNLDKYRRHIGYDPHFTAYGNAAIGIWTPGDLDDASTNTQVGINIIDGEGAVVNGSFAHNNVVIDQTYLGSSNPKLTYDSVKDRFGFADFYTPEYLGNNGGAGDDKDGNPVRDGNATVYKINKRLTRQNFAPGLQKYETTKSSTLKKIDGTSVTVKLQGPHKTIYPFSIMDCHSGIAIEKFGITNELWENSLMGILGFSYDNLQAPISLDNTFQMRVNTYNQNKLNKVTTQAVVKAVDTLLYNQNLFGALMYKPNVLTTVGVTGVHQTPGNTYLSWANPIVIDSDSLTITGSNVPKSMLNPFFSIRSDLIDDTSVYFGSSDSGQRLPTMAVIQKNYNSGDYVYGGESSVQFTVTKPKVVTSITTSITDPNGTYSRVDDSSAIVYKIQKNRTYPVNLLQQLFGKK